MTTVNKCRLNAGLIGHRLIEAGYLTQDRLHDALIAQRETGLLLGEVCMIRGWLTYEQLMHCLRPTRSKLGNKLLGLDKITIQQLWMALLEQRTSGEKLGQILLRRGWVDQHTLENA
ncbi:MAG TPA: hypothetical protein V6D22_12365 [Candidatus Obscuribacterales bacterium]